VFLLAACSAAPEPGSLEAFRRQFSELEAFCPEGVRSCWYRVQPRPDGPIREFRCGTRFTFQALGRVEYDGVTVQDHGRDGADDVRLRALGWRELRSDGVRLWRRDEAAPPYSGHPGMDKAVATVVDGRYVVMATSEDLLFAALRKPRAARLRLPASPTSARCLKDVIWSDYLNVGPHVAAIDADTDRLLLWSPRGFNLEDAALPFWGYQPVPETHTLSDGWHYLEWMRTASSIEEDPWLVERTCQQFFGIIIVY